jgi:hypothetical protein
MVQTAVNQYQVLGVPGEFADDSPSRVAPYSCLANSTAQPTVGYAFTQGTADNEAIVGGTGAFLGVLVEPKQYANYANLNPTMAVNPGTNGEICSMGHIFVTSLTEVKPNYVAAFDNATGAISGYAAAASIPETSTQIPGKFIKVSAPAGQVAILELGSFAV